MKKIFFLSCIFILYGYGEILSDLKSFSADFMQQIDDKENQIVTYYGQIYAKKPQTALWRYTKPVIKDVYINNRSVVIVEPELEQVLIRKIKDDFNLFEILKTATKVTDNLYSAHYKDFQFTLIFDGKDIKELTYKDNFENLVRIKFSNQKYNINLKNSIFQPNIPKEYDIISE